MIRKIYKIIIRIIALYFIFLWVNYISHMFICEGMGVTPYTVTLGLLIGVIINIGLLLSTTSFWYQHKIIITISLIFPIMNFFILPTSFLTDFFSSKLVEIISIFMVLLTYILVFIILFRKRSHECLK